MGIIMVKFCGTHPGLKLDPRMPMFSFVLQPSTLFHKFEPSKMGEHKTGDLSTQNMACASHMGGQY